MGKTGKTQRRLRKLMWNIRVPTWSDNAGILLPTRHPSLTPGISKEIYFGTYESKEIEIVSRRLEADDVVMEVGAGIGYLSAWCARRIGNEHVFAYEANPGMMEVIAETHAHNGVQPTVKNVMLGDSVGSRTFYVEKEFWASSLIKTSDNARAIEVPQVDMNAEIGAIKPTFLIVDIEGGETEFFATADLSSVRKICIETHPAVIGDDGVSALFGRFIAAGFVLDCSLIRKNVFFFYRPAAN